MCEYLALASFVTRRSDDLRLPRLGRLITFFFFNDTATTEIYTLSLHDALPISCFLASLAAASTESAKMPGTTPIFRGAARALPASRAAPRKAASRGQRVGEVVVIIAFLCR